MNTPRIIHDFLRMNNNDLEAKGNTVFTHMNGNPNFPTLADKVTDFKAKLDAFVAALAKAEKGSSEDRQIRDRAKTVLQQAMLDLSRDVESVAQGDRVKLASSGYTISKETFSSPHIGSINNFLVMHGPVSGSMVLSLDAVDNALTYIFSYALSPVAKDEDWTDVTITVRTCTVEGLTLGQNYCFRVAAIARKDQRVVSDVITKMVV